MFEKEADEYAEKVYGNRTEVDHYGIADAFQEGAEFGYNKALEEATQDELKDEMKNRISLALKDPILQQGFEIICKNLVELEERIHTLEVYLEGAINFLILNGDVDNPIIKSVENILHITFNKNRITFNKNRRQKNEREN